jgi:ABC-type long-subunit fatty acid transport system fused permease/ATPase subunit
VLLAALFIRNIVSYRRAHGIGSVLVFLPVLVRFSSNVTELPLIGSVPFPLVFAAVIWSVFGTGGPR